MRILVTPLTIAVFALASCQSFSKDGAKNIKDLDENMIDLRMYHENLGDAIVRQDQDIALWLETGMDSVLNVVAMKFDEHRKLEKPFRESYQKDLKPSISQLHEALEARSWPKARTAYTLLTRKCNGCHKDLDIDKDVQNWLERKQ
jgi:hypothetical protein